MLTFEVKLFIISLCYMQFCSQMFDLQKVVALDCCRLVKYDEYQDSLERSFENEMDVPMSKLLGGVKQSYSFDLLLETKRPDQVFQDYKPGGEWKKGVWFKIKIKLHT